MDRNTVGKKAVAIGIVLLLILSLNLSIFGSSGAVINQADGTWFDTFDNENDISETVNCVISNGSIKLAEGTNTFDYDYGDDSGDNDHEAFATDITLISGEQDLFLPRNLLTEMSLGNLDYEYIEQKDGDVIVTEASYVDMELLGITYTFTPVHHFRFKIDQSKSNIENIRFIWWYGPKDTDANIDDILLYVWNHSFSLIDRWTLVEEAAYNANSDSNNIVFTSGSGGHYIGEDGNIDFLVVAMPEIDGETCAIATDYVDLTVTSRYGYMAEGHICSTDINPTSLGSWESVIWKSTGASDVSYVEIKVMNGDDVLASGKTSPLDLSSIASATYGDIKIKAMLNSDDLSISPQLYSWAVTWQTTSGEFRDRFSTDLRIDEDVGVDISNDVTMSDYYGNWPVFGKDAANTRAYEGYGPTEGDIYWETKKETVGGGFRSPVLSEGIVYLASPKDDTIYAYNASKPSGDYRDSSDSNYKVDSSVAVGGDYVIVPTGEINASNKIYALDKDNLVNEIWQYPYSSSGDICFSSAPTISDEKVFVTSWNGMIWDTPLLSFLYSYKILDGNNKIIALNLIDGEEIWDYDLPAGSFSTPAVADDMVFVGCDNMFGNNLFAFEEGSGTIIWNVSVGLIGRSSPVVYDDKVFIVVKNQSLFSLRADVKIVALDQYTGEKLWNQTIGENLFAFELLPRGLGLYNLMFTSTPAVFDGKLYVTSPDGSVHAFTTEGEKLWTNDEIPSSVFGIPTFSCTSPVISSNYLYVAMPNGVIHALDPDDGEAEWEFDCEMEDPELFSPTYILASPIVADGVLYASVTEELSTYSGRIYAIGDYSPNQIGRLVSNPIYVPPGYWWNEFKVDFTHTSTDSINFSILDENDNLLLNDVEDKQDISDSSIVNSNAIKLSARFLREDRNYTPVLDNWGVTWTVEGTAPTFDLESFVPDPDGWINTNTPVFSVQVYDAGSGLDIGSAKYIISYKDEDNKTVTPSAFTPSFSTNATDGTNKKVTLVADLSALDIASEISDLLSIEFSIKDLARNKATYKIDSFKKDTVKPSSKIENIDSFLDGYNEPVNITAEYDDDTSGVKTIALYYMKPGDSDWTLFREVESPFSWLFNITNSSKYELCTVAKDKAGNLESFPDEGDVSFVFDMIEPSKPELEDEYRYNSLPELSVKFTDDYQLKDAFFRLNFHGLNEWTRINDNVIDSKTYTGKWTLSEEDWDYMEEDEYYVFFKLVDSSGNEYITPSGDYEDALILVKDLTASRSYLDIDEIPEWNWDNEFAITALPDESDIEDMELYYRYSTDNENWGDWKKYGDALTTAPFEWKFTANDGSGFYQFKTKVTDAAGNVGESEPETVSLTLFPMIAMSLMIILAIILIIVTVLIQTSIKKKK